MTEFQTGIETVVLFFMALAAVIKKYDLIKKLRIPSAIASHVAEQGKDTAIAKLQVPDDVLSILNSFAMGEDGKIVLEKASLVLQDQGRFNTLRTLNRPLTDAEKDEFIAIVKRVMCAYKE